jgi:hypothetical protein
MPTASWGLVEVNECLSCSRVGVLYVNSLSNIMEPVWRFSGGATINQMARCLECNNRSLRRLCSDPWADDETTRRTMEEISHLQDNPPPEYAYDNPTCFMCEGIILDNPDSHPNHRGVSVIMNDTINADSVLLFITALSVGVYANAVITLTLVELVVIMPTASQLN